MSETKQTEIQTELTQGDGFTSFTSEEVEQVANLVKVITEQGEVSLNPIELSARYPKTMEELKKFIEKVTRIQPNTELLVTILAYNPTNILFKFFDEKKMFINIGGSDFLWIYTINNTPYQQPTYTSRAQATSGAFQIAFEQSELNQ